MEDNLHINKKHIICERDDVGNIGNYITWNSLTWMRAKSCNIFALTSNAATCKEWCSDKHDYLGRQSRAEYPQFWEGNLSCH
jgi:hypothetical protein